MVNGILKETIAVNKPRAVAQWIKNTKANTTHRLGKIVLVENGKQK